MRDVDHGGGCGYLGKGSRGNLCTSAQFCCQHITALKSEVNLKKNQRGVDESDENTIFASALQNGNDKKAYQSRREH